MFRTFAGGLATALLLATSAPAANVTGEFTNPLDIIPTDFHYFIAGKGAGLEMPITTDAGGKAAFDLEEADTGSDGVTVTMIANQTTSFGVPGKGTFTIKFSAFAIPGPFTMPLDKTFFTYAGHDPVAAEGTWTITKTPLPAAAGLALTGLLDLLAPRRLRRRAATA